MIEIFINGGPLMYPILVCSVIGWAIFLERIRTYRKVYREMPPVLRQVEELLLSGNPEQAVACCRANASPLARILLVVLTANKAQRSQIKELADEVGSRETVALQRYLGLLATIANIAPLLGLLGTVFGMIEAFNIIARVGAGTPATLGGGISEALITTAAGLSVAVPMILIHRYLSSRADRLVLEMEANAIRIVNLVAE
jgi:biopolymer transport protein ExbB